MVCQYVHIYVPRYYGDGTYIHLDPQFTGQFNECSSVSEQVINGQKECIYECICLVTYCEAVYIFATEVNAELCELTSTVIS